MLDARENRVKEQRKLLQQFHKPLVSFTLNIAGPIKVFPLAVKTYEEGLRLILCQCKAFQLPVLKKQEMRKPTGYECFLVVNAPAKKVKKALCELEEKSSLGRLFDIDVLDADGKKVTRMELGLPERTCLLCSRPAAECSRARAHSVEELQIRTCEIIWDYFSEKYAALLASIAVRALLYEVLATPKPGLVDQNNSGAHRDMSIFTFESSALALLPYFKAFISYGIAYSRKDAADILSSVRPIGIQAEIAMLHATDGINTHKGIIFSLGILCTALGRLYGIQEPYDRSALQKECQKISAPLQADFKGITKDSAVSNGEKLYVSHGIRGVRGEAIDGFPVLFLTALPRFGELREQGFNLNDAGVLTLLSIITESEDTNIMIRSSYEEAREIQERLKLLIQKKPEKQNYQKLLLQLDQEFINRNISPGGSADMLALTYFIYLLEGELGENPYLK